RPRSLYHFIIQATSSPNFHSLSLHDALPILPFIIITGQGDERVAVEMMKRGASDYVVKEKDFLEVLPPVVDRVLAKLKIEERLRSEEHTSELQSRENLVCRRLLEKKKRR